MSDLDALAEFMRVVETASNDQLQEILDAQRKSKIYEHIQIVKREAQFREISLRWALTEQGRDAYWAAAMAATPRELQKMYDDQEEHSSDESQMVCAVAAKRAVWINEHRQPVSNGSYYGRESFRRD